MSKTETGNHLSTQQKITKSQLIEFLKDLQFQIIQFRENSGKAFSLHYRDSSEGEFNPITVHKYSSEFVQNLIKKWNSIFEFEIKEELDYQNIVIKWPVKIDEYDQQNYINKLYLPWNFFFIKSETKLLIDIENLMKRVDGTFDWEKTQAELSIIIARRMIS